MKNSLACVVCFSLCTVLANAGGAGKGALNIEGVWNATGVIGDGKKVPDDDVNKLMLFVTIKADKYSVSVMGNEVEAGTYKLDAKKKPAHINVTITKGTDKGKMQYGLIKLEGDVMTVAIAKGDKADRPKNFDGGERIDVTILKRGK